MVFRLRQRACYVILATIVHGGVSEGLAQERGGQQSPLDGAHLQGRVVLEGYGRGARGVVIRLLRQGVSATTDSAGRFELVDLEAGTDTLVIVTEDFASDPIPVHLSPGGVHQVELVVPIPVAVLEELRVDIRRNRHLSGFEARRKLRVGEFITREEIERANPPETSMLLRGIPRIRVTPRGVLLEERGPRGPRGCQPAMFIDGRARDPKLTRVDDIPARRLRGIEVYHAPRIPGRFFDPLYPCGSIVIWTSRAFADG